MPGGRRFRPGTRHGSPRLRPWGCGSSFRHFQLLPSEDAVGLEAIGFADRLGRGPVVACDGSKGISAFHLISHSARRRGRLWKLAGTHRRLCDRLRGGRLEIGAGSNGRRWGSPTRERQRVHWGGLRRLYYWFRRGFEPRGCSRRRRRFGRVTKRLEGVQGIILRHGPSLILPLASLDKHRHQENHMKREDGGDGEKELAVAAWKRPLQRGVGWDDRTGAAHKIESFPNSARVCALPSSEQWKVWKVWKGLQTPLHLTRPSRMGM